MRGWFSTSTSGRSARPGPVRAFRLGGIPLSLVIGLVAAGCVSGRGQPGPSPSAGTTPPTAVQTTGPPGLAADSLVSADARGELFELSAVDGAVRRTLAGPEETGGPPGHLAIAPDRRSVYFDRGRTGCWSEFAYVGPSGVTGEGAWPTPDRTGTRVAAVGGADPCLPDMLWVYQIGTGARRAWPTDAREGSAGLSLHGPLSWSADGRRLAVPTSGPAVRIVALDAVGTVSGWQVLPAQPNGRVLAAFFIGSAGSEALITLEACCGAAPGSFRLGRRALLGSSAGPPVDPVTVPEPKDIRVTARGEVTLTTKAGVVMTGLLPTLHELPGRFVAADRG